MSNDINHSGLDRRQFLRLGSVAALGGAAYLGGVLPGSVLASVTPQSVPPRALSFFNTHTAETLELVYFERGEYLADALQAINRLLRDHRTDEIKPIDVHLLDLLFTITEKLDAKQSLQVVSGFRSPRSNAQLRRSGRGVASKSYHMTGQAIDIRIPDTSLRSLRQVAIDLKSGGVGYYPRSGFVHVDTGPIRTW